MVDLFSNNLVFYGKGTKSNSLRFKLFLIEKKIPTQRSSYRQPSSHCILPGRNPMGIFFRNYRIYERSFRYVSFANTHHRRQLWFGRLRHFILQFNNRTVFHIWIRSVPLDYHLSSVPPPPLHHLQLAPFCAYCVYDHLFCLATMFALCVIVNPHGDPPSNVFLDNACVHQKPKVAELLVLYLLNCWCLTAIMDRRVAYF